MVLLPLVVMLSRLIRPVGDNEGEEEMLMRLEISSCTAEAVVSSLSLSLLLGLLLFDDAIIS